MKTETPLRRALRARGLSMREAAKAGIPYQTIVGHSLGLRRMTLTSAQRYTDLLGIPILELIDAAQSTPTTPPGDAGAESPPSPQEAQDA